MAISIVQSKFQELETDADGIINCVMTSAITEGSLLVATAVARDATLLNEISAYTNSSVYQITGDSSWKLARQETTTGAGHRGGIWWKIATASEDTDIHFASGEAGCDLGIEVVEFAHDFTTPIVYSAQSGFASDTSGTTVQPGSTGAAESQPVLWFGFGSFRRGDTDITVDTGTETPAGDWAPSGSRWRALSAWLEASATTAQNWTWTASPNSSSRWAMLVGFVESDSAVKLIAEGNNITTTKPGDGYVYHTFNESGTLALAPGETSVDVEYAVVAGGGGAGANVTGGSGGGGAGGMKVDGGTPITISSTQTVTIGAGGAGGGPGSQGSASSVGALVTTTGGGGGSTGSNAGTSGGSGGGGSWNNHQPGLSGTIGEGNNGGSGTYATWRTGGGGGGKISAGSSGDGSTVGTGGAGLAWNGTTYATGGRGGGNNSATGSGDPDAGGANTGDGGSSGTSAATPGTGGSGIVIVRYPSSTEYRRTKATDDFNRANEVLDASANWTVIGATDPSVSSNQVALASGSDTGGLWNDTFDNDQWAEIDVTRNGGEAGVGVRITDPGAGTFDGYFAVWGGDTVILYNASNGGFGSIGTSSSIGTTGTKTLRIEAISTIISVYVDDVLEIQVNNSARTTGKPGFYIGATSSTLDNFSAGIMDTVKLGGGDIVLPGDGYAYHTFKSSGTLDIVTGETSVAVEYLVVAGGGGGHITRTAAPGGTPGGQGAGGARPGTTTISSAQTVTVGAGGAGATVATGNGTNGTASSLGALSADGGSSNTTWQTGTNTGTGSGAAGNLGDEVGYPDTEPGQLGGAYGNDGGLSYAYTQSFNFHHFNSGGGGGAGGAGGDATASAAGAPGAALEWPTGSGQYYAEGGSGGSTNAGATHTDPQHGGGRACRFYYDSGLHEDTVAGTANTGGGGGSTVNYALVNWGDTGSDGGSGIVIVRYSVTPIFNPQTKISWHSLFWAEGSAFTAQGYADAASVTTWPNETGEADGAEATNPPTFTEVTAAFNGKPSVTFADSVSKLQTAAFTTPPTYPISIVMVARKTSISAGEETYWHDGITSSNRAALIERFSSNRHVLYAGSDTPDSDDLNDVDSDAHLYITRWDGASNTTADELWRDERLLISVSGGASAGSQEITGLTFAGRYNTPVGVADTDIAFLGIYEGNIRDNANYNDFLGWLGEHYALPVSSKLVGGSSVSVPGDGYVYHTFKESDTLSLAPGETSVAVEYLVVAGGGGGGSGTATGFGGHGGGGAGGMKSGTSLTISSPQTITVGAGGSPGLGGTVVTATSGSTSAIGALVTTTGGGAGADLQTAVPAIGGSGGGGGGTSNQTGAAGTSGEGLAGGNGGGNNSAGGGGGKTAVGGNGDGGTSTPGAGGAGAEWPTGSGTYYAGGGGGGGRLPASSAAGGIGGGGAGGWNDTGNQSGISSTANTGGGGGGSAYDYDGGAGGSGIIIVRYALDAPAGDLITDYLVEYRTTAGPGAWQVFADGVDPTTGATVTGLTPGASYDFRISARNSAGWGLWSNTTTVIAGGAGTVSIYFGDTQLVGLALGDTTVTAAYLGDTQIL